MKGYYEDYSYVGFNEKGEKMRFVTDKEYQEYLKKDDSEEDDNNDES